MAEKFNSYAEFWNYYLSQHTHPKTRFWHTVGLFCGLAVAVLLIVTGHYFWALAAPAVGYAFAWYSHFFIEHNRPATWEYPFWSLISEFRMAALILLGRL